MDPEQTFIRVQERFSEMLTPKIRAKLEYFFLFLAITLFCILVVMHANYVQQPGCSSEFSSIQVSDAQLIQIKITSAGLWSHNESGSDAIDVHDAEADSEIQKPTNVDEDGSSKFDAESWLSWIKSDIRRVKSSLEVRRGDNDVLVSQREASFSNEKFKSTSDDIAVKASKNVPRSSFFVSPKESLRAAIVHICKKWHGRLSSVLRPTKLIIGGLLDVAGIHLNFDIPKWLKILHLDRLNSYAVQCLEKRSKAFEPAYLYTMEKGYFLLPEEARLKHSIRTINISISARHNCFGNRWQQLLINRLVGYDTILMNSLLSSPGLGYLYNYQTNEFYNLTYAHDQPESSAKFGVLSCDQVWRIDDVTFCFLHNHDVGFIYIERDPDSYAEVYRKSLQSLITGVAFISDVLNFHNPNSFLQLQHHARHRLPTFQLIFVHVIESLVFVPIMIGILFFLFEFYDDQLLAFMVLILVWICELFTLISVRTPISMKFFPRFFLLYFLVFHIYFFSYTYGFSYLALSTATAFMQHLILYFWNRFEVPALQRFMQNRRSHFQQHPDFHITSSTILASTLRITRLNTRNTGAVAAAAAVNTDVASGAGAGAGSGTTRSVATGFSGSEEQRPNTNNGNNSNADRLGNPLDIGGQRALGQQENGGVPGAMSSFSSLLLWILGGASSESLNSFLSIFRDQGQVYAAGTPQQENHTSTQNNE
ncbi:hypothetical protein OROGR_018939 [Orobanche gracilis]